MFFEAILGDHSKVSDVSRHYYLSPVTWIITATFCPASVPSPSETFRFSRLAA
jgi:hypothetical protein